MISSPIKSSLLIAALAMLPAQGVLAEDEVKLDTITVTATKSAKHIDGVTASVKVITAQDIETIGAADLKDVFEKTPGLTLQYGTFPAASSASKSAISIRGLGANGTLFLIDGRRISSEVQNPYEVDRIPASMIERIEIIKGPMSVLYGADATGGVINIITKQPEKAFSGTVNVKGGTNKDGDASRTSVNLTIQGKIDRLGYSFYTSLLTTDPYTERERTTTLIKTSTGNVPPSTHTNPKIQNIKNHYNVDVTYREDSEIFTIGGRITHDIFDATLLGISFNYLTEEREGEYRAAFFPTGVSPAPGKRIPAFDTPVHSEDDNWRRDIGVDLRSNLSDELILNLKIYNSYYEKRNTTTALNWQDAGFASKAASANLAMNADVDIWSYEAFMVYAFGENHLITTGAEYREETRDASVFNVDGIVERRAVEYKAIYLQNEWQINDSLSATLGGRYDDISNAENKATFKAGLVNKFSPLYILRVNFAQGYRTPNIRELYIRRDTPRGAQRGASVADPVLGKLPFDLKPEFINSYEIGLSGRSGGFNYSVALFYNDITDKIEQVTRNAGTPQLHHTFVNINDVTTQGIELALGYDFKSGLGLSFNWYELDTENDQTGKELEFNPERQLSGTVSYKADRLNIWAKGRYVGEQYAPEAAGNWVDSYFLTDLGGSYALGTTKQYEIYGGINNLFDESTDKLIGSNVGPYFFAGLRVNF